MLLMSVPPARMILSLFYFQYTAKLEAEVRGLLLPGRELSVDECSDNVNDCEQVRGRHQSAMKSISSFQCF